MLVHMHVPHTQKTGQKPQMTVVVIHTQRNVAVPLESHQKQNRDSDLAQVSREKGPCQRTPTTTTMILMGTQPETRSRDVLRVLTEIRALMYRS